MVDEILFVAEGVTSVRTRKVKIGGRKMEIPENMDAADMVSCWQGDSRTLEEFVNNLVRSSPRLALEVVKKYCRVNGYWLMPDPARAVLRSGMVADEQAAGD